MLADQVETYRQTNSGIDFRLHRPDTMRVYADPTLIKEAVGNLLGNAASLCYRSGWTTARLAVVAIMLAGVIFLAAAL